VTRAGWVCLAFGVVGCKPTPPPTSTPTPAMIAGSLVEAGCATASLTLVQSVQAELEAGSVPAWISCLAAGGTVASCAVPCDSTTVTVIHTP
jgi:hypothetical protein